MIDAIKVGNGKCEYSVFIVLVKTTRVKMISDVGERHSTYARCNCKASARGKETDAKSRIVNGSEGDRNKGLLVRLSTIVNTAIIFLEAGRLSPDPSSASFPITINGRADASRDGR